MFPEQINILLTEIEQKNFLKDVVRQLNKDFLLANLDIAFREDIQPTILKKQLWNVLKDLFQNQYDSYINFLYRVDVSEKELKEHLSDNIEKSLEAVVFVVLKREYQKVWFRNKF